jgi:GGDEF domain-containing protein
MLARLGGDEFAALLTRVRNRTEVEEIARRLERSFDDPYSFDGHSIFAPQEIAKGVAPEVNSLSRQEPA